MPYPIQGPGLHAGDSPTITGNWTFAGTTTFTGRLYVQANTGIYGSSGPILEFLVDNALVARMLSNGLYFQGNKHVFLSSDGAVAWNSGVAGLSTSDTFLYRDAANVLAQRNELNAQEFRVYAKDSVVNHYAALKSAKVTKASVSGASVTCTGLIPDGAVVVGLTTEITEALGATNGTTGFTVGDGSDADRWGVQTAITVSAVTKNTDWTTTTIQMFNAAQDVVLTAVGGNFDGTGSIEVIVHYIIAGAA